MPTEFELIDRHFVRPTPGALLGPGDDCALLVPSPGAVLAVTTDMLVTGTHFFADTDPGSLGWKTLAVSLSDLAAMGATPRWALLAGALPEADESWLAAFSAGLFDCADRHGCELVGGDTTRGPRCLSLTAIGELPAGVALRRDGAKAGDDIWVSGTPGLANLALRVLRDGLTLPEGLRQQAMAALHRPQPRVALGLALRSLASAAIDVSDGLLGDLAHILERSRVGAEVLLTALPPLPEGIDTTLARRAQLSGGDDYELVFCASPAHREAVRDIGVRLALPLTRIGRIVDDPSTTLRVVDGAGAPVDFSERGYDHFR